jgi:predicted alpha/beta superfamily hydrolase
MLRVLLVTGFLLLQAAAQSQVKVRIELNRLPSYHPAGAEVFIAGSFNRWNPGDARYRLETQGGKSGITIDLPRGRHEFKFTRGSWATVEAGAGGRILSNRSINVQNDTTLTATVEEWTDQFPRKPKATTSSSNVHIVDTAFFMPQLNRYRRISIYLPPSYAGSRKRYPVLYMHDGQNVFDEATSFSGEWGVDETLDSLGARFGELIVVAIDNGGDKRLNEYAPYDMEQHGKGEGEAYVSFLANTLIPHINTHYRTLRAARSTFIAGSSMGGLISFYAMLRYPNRFGAAGVFSPAFWINPAILHPDPRKAKKVKGRIYFFAGQQESERMVPDMLQVFEQMQQHSGAEMQTVIRAEGTHSEATWRGEFPLFYEWLMKKRK